MIHKVESDPEPYRERQRILVADDNPRLLKSLSDLLGEHGYQVSMATDGNEACRLLQRHPFTLAFLDLNMPGRDGFQVMEEACRLQPRCALVVVSGETSFLSVSRALRRGASDYIRKPFDPEEVLATLENVLGRQSLLRAHEDVQQRLEKSETLHRYIVNNSPDIVFMLDEQGRFCFLNRKVSNLLGYQPSDLIGQHFRLLLHEVLVMSWD